MPAPVSADDVDDAVARLRGRVRRTPVVELGRGALGLDVDLVVKLECLQHTGSFKPRGAFNNVLGSGTTEAGLVAASGGNHGAAVAYVASRLGLRAEIFVPEVTPEIKRTRIAGFGGIVTVGGAMYDDAQDAADRRATETGALLVHPYDAELTVAGQATCGRELLEQVPDAAMAVVAVGGGGFGAGVALACSEHMEVVTVEPETSACFNAALAAGHPLDVEVSGLAADSLGTRRVGQVPWAVLAERVSQSVVVPDEAIRSAQTALWSELRIVAEPGGAAALAGLLHGRIDVDPGTRVVVIVCGSNTDPATVGS